MKKNIVIVLLISILTLSFTVGCQEKAPEESDVSKDNEEITKENNDEEAEKTDDEEITEPLQIGDKAHNFTLETLEGETVSLEDYRGKIVLLNFWATT